MGDMSNTSSLGWNTGISSGTSIISGLLNLFSQGEANKQNLRLAEQERTDTLAAQKANRKQTQQQIDLNTRQQTFNEQDTMYNRGVTQEKTNYDRAKDQYNEAIKTLSTKSSLNQVRMAPFAK